MNSELLDEDEKVDVEEIPELLAKIFNTLQYSTEIPSNTNVLLAVSAITEINTMASMPNGGLQHCEKELEEAYENLRKKLGIESEDG